MIAFLFIHVFSAISSSGGGEHVSLSVWQYRQLPFSQERLSARL